MPEGITGEELPKPLRAELSTLPAAVAAQLARHLVAAGALLDDDPEQAFAHAWFARQQAPRLAVTREAAGLAAYAAGKYAEAMPELRAARRLTGAPTLLPVIADVERALGRPERALEIAASDEAGRLDPEGRIEMRIVAAGARRDLGQLDAAVLTLQVPEIRTSPRLAYAYADALLAAGRREQARAAFERTTLMDRLGETDAEERLAELEGVVFVDALDALDEESEEVAPDVARERADSAPPDEQNEGDQLVPASSAEPGVVADLGDKADAEEQAPESEGSTAAPEPEASTGTIPEHDGTRRAPHPGEDSSPFAAPTEVAVRPAVSPAPAGNPLFVPPAD